MIMFDTNAASAVVQNEAGIKAFTASHRGMRFVLSAITAGELLFGIERRPAHSVVARRLQLLFATIETLPWTLEAARTYGRIRSDCERRGRAIGHLDMLIAAHAVSAGARLVTRDKSFGRLKLGDLQLATF